MRKEDIDCVSKKAISSIRKEKIWENGTSGEEIPVGKKDKRE
jgi:hypothetical protein